MHDPNGDSRRIHERINLAREQVSTAREKYGKEADQAIDAAKMLADQSAISRFCRADNFGEEIINWYRARAPDARR